MNPAKPFTWPDEENFHLAFDNPEPSVPLDLAPFIPTSPAMKGEEKGERFFSTCRLSNVVEVTLCRSQGGYPDSIIGMLVKYANGDRACVGAFRFDWASEPCQVGQAGTLDIGCTQEPRWVRDIQLEPPPVDSNLAWMTVPWSGRLEWWFSRKQSAVYHFESEPAHQPATVNFGIGVMFASV